MNRFEGQAALVTGGRSGIGKAIAHRLAAEGAQVITVQRGHDAACDYIEADLADPAVPAQVVAEAAARLGRLDILVNNAGMMREATVGEIPAAEWQRTLTVNLTAPFLLIQAALPWLAAHGGRIVNVGSIEGLAANPGHVAYAVSKAGLHGLTRAVAVELGPMGVRCNAVAPGWIDTDLNEDFIDNMPDPAAFRREIGNIHPVGRTGTADEVAALVAFLAADESGFVTGEIYRIDGGRMTQLSLP